MAHAMRKVSSTLIYPSSVECLHAIEKGVMKFSFPPFGTAPRRRLSIPLLKGKATFEQFLTGYSTIDSDCLGKPFTAPDGEYVAKAIVRLTGTITVRTYDAKLINDRTDIVITDKIMFNRSDSINQVNEPSGDSVAAHLYAATKNELEVFHDLVEGLFVANRSHIPETSCDTAQTVWTSQDVTLHKAINPSTPDIVEVSRDAESEHISILLKGPAQICGRKVFKTAITELVVLFLSPHDAPLPNPSVSAKEVDQWIYVKSMVMSSTTASELSLDDDFNKISFEICEANRQHLITRLQGIRAESEGLVFDVLGHPTLPVLSGEIVYLFHCRQVWGRIRTASNICSQELPVTLDDGRQVFMKPTSHRISSHYTPRPCSTVTVPGYNLGSPESPQWIYLDIQGNPHTGPVPQTFNFSHMVRHGVELPNLDGVYTSTQLESLQEQTMRGDAILAISNHLAARVSQTQNTLSSSTFQSLLDHNLQSAIEASTTPWPYNLANFLPSWLRTGIAIIVILLFLSIFAKPFYALLIFASTSTVTIIDFLKMVFFTQFFAFRAHFTARDLKLKPAATEDPQSLPMLPIPYRPEEGDTQATMQQMIKDVDACVAKITALEQDNSNLHAKIKHLESAVRKQVAMTKNLDSKVNPAEIPKKIVREC